MFVIDLDEIKAPCSMPIRERRSSGKNLRNYFVYNITKFYWTESSWIRWGSDFGNYCQEYLCLKWDYFKLILTGKQPIDVAKENLPGCRT